MFCYLIILNRFQNLLKEEDLANELNFSLVVIVAKLIYGILTGGST